MAAVIAQSDLVSAYGWGIDALWAGLLSGRSAVGQSSRFAERRFISEQMAVIGDLDVPRDGSRVMAMLRRLLSPLVGAIDSRTPLILATTVGEIEYVERSVLEGKPELAREARPDMLLARVASFLGLNGETMVVSSACASSSAALTRAAAMVRRGRTQSVLVVAADAVSELVFSGFSSLQGMSDRPARPFDADRNGLTLGEAAAWALVTDASRADSSATRIVGWGNTADAVHMTAPDREAGGLRKCIANALEMSGKSAADVGFIAAHGTATQFSDAMEMKAFKAALGERRPVFSVKGGTGHTLGSAGLVQALVVGRCLATHTVPPTVGLSKADADAAGWVSTSARSCDSPLAMSTSSGFGGVNTVLLLGRGGAP